MRQLTILLDCDDTISIFMETCINKYNEMIEKFEGKKGILYLDSGNYFQIK